MHIEANRNDNTQHATEQNADTRGDAMEATLHLTHIHRTLRALVATQWKYTPGYAKERNANTRGNAMEATPD
jgi:hypothetical protein